MVPWPTMNERVRRARQAYTAVLELFHASTAASKQTQQQQQQPTGCYPVQHKTVTLAQLASCVTEWDDGGGGGEKDERLPAVLISQLAHQSEPYRPEDPSNLRSRTEQAAVNR